MVNKMIFITISYTQLYQQIAYGTFLVKWTTILMTKFLEKKRWKEFITSLKTGICSTARTSVDFGQDKQDYTILPIHSHPVTMYQNFRKYKTLLPYIIVTKIPITNLNGNFQCLSNKVYFKTDMSSFAHKLQPHYTI